MAVKGGFSHPHWKMAFLLNTGGRLASNPKAKEEGFSGNGEKQRDCFSCNIFNY
jgi:hypothetical protein